MNRPFKSGDFKPRPQPCKTAPSWDWDVYSKVGPSSARESAGYIVGSHTLFHAFAVVGDMPISLGIFVGRAAAAAAIVDAHGGDVS